MDILNSVFGARGKKKGDKKKVQAVGMYINCLY